MKISYGKLRVPLQRIVKRDDGDHDVLACEVSIEVLGENFAAAYVEGDNSAVVATDTMKNIILRESLAYGGDTLDRDAQLAVGDLHAGMASSRWWAIRAISPSAVRSSVS